MRDDIRKRIDAVRRGEVPEGYEPTSVGLLPSSWSKSSKRLCEISEVLRVSAGQQEYETVSISAGVGFVNQAEKFGKELSGKQYEKYTVLHRGDFSYNKGNSNLYPQGCIYRLNDREEAAVPNVFESFRIVDGCPEYYEKLFESGFLNHQLYRLINHGVRDDGLLNLTEKDFYSCLLPVPPLCEQRRIAEILSACDKVIALKQNLLEELKLLKKACLAKMFPRDGADEPEIRFPGFTEPWKHPKLGEITQSYSGGTPSVEVKEYYGGEIAFIRSAEINCNSTALFLTELGLRNSSARLVNEGDILYALYGATSGEVGRARLTGAINQAILAIVPNDGYDKEFITQWLRKSKRRILDTYLQGGQGNLSGALVKNLKLDVPKHEEQVIIGSFFSSLDILIDHHQRELEAEQQKKKALMQLLLTGLVRVNT